MNKITWFAVVIELETAFVDHTSEYGVNKKTGNLLKADIQSNGKIYSVGFKCGSALHELAVEKAEMFGGIVVEVKSDYAFDVRDIDLNMLLQAA